MEHVEISDVSRRKEKVAASELGDPSPRASIVRSGSSSGATRGFAEG
jgi:hypothetical protein